MILKLNDILITNTHTGNVWVSLVSAADNTSGGLFYTGGFLISAFDTTGRVWISNQSPDGFGEGMETSAAKLADFLSDRLFDTANKTVELLQVAFNAVMADFYR